MGVDGDARVEHLVEELVQSQVVLLQDRLGDLVAEVGFEDDVELREELDDHEGFRLVLRGGHVGDLAAGDVEHVLLALGGEHVREEVLLGARSERGEDLIAHRVGVHRGTPVLDRA